jgi:DUF1680 family protein
MSSGKPGSTRFQSSSEPSTTIKLFATDAWTSGADSKVILNGTELDTTFENGFVCISMDLRANDTLIFDSEIKLHTFDSYPCVNNSKEYFSFRHGPMMLGVKSALASAEDEPTEINIAMDAVVKPLGSDRHETVTISGDKALIQPMWGKENLIDPLDVYQVLFAK